MIVILLIIALSLVSPLWLHRIQPVKIVLLNGHAMN